MKVSRQATKLLRFQGKLRPRSPATSRKGLRKLTEAPVESQLGDQHMAQFHGQVACHSEALKLLGILEERASWPVTIRRHVEIPAVQIAGVQEEPWADLSLRHQQLFAKDR